MSHFLDRLTFLQKNVDTFADGHGVTTREDRTWEESYRQRWQHDKIVRSTHGVNCTGSCSWKIYVKGGIVTWETQQTDYPRTRPDLPNHEPRGCARGASYSWYLYSGARLKYPLVRSRLLKAWRQARALRTPVAAWASIVEDPAKRSDYIKVRGHGGFVRSTWDEVNEIIAAANAYTAKTHGPDRIFGFSPIPAMSMVSYAAGARYLSLIGGVCGSFYDWYCDLPPASPQTWGEQTDVPESADWYNAGFLMIWGSNVPQTRTPDAHFYTEVRYKGTKSVVVSPDYAEATKFADLWLNPKQGTDAALALAMGHVILREYHLDRSGGLFRGLRPQVFRHAAARQAGEEGRALCARPSPSCRRGQGRAWREPTTPDWKTVGIDDATGELVVPHGSIGFRWGDTRQVEPRRKGRQGPRDEAAPVACRGSRRDRRQSASPISAAGRRRISSPPTTATSSTRNLPAKKVAIDEGRSVWSSRSSTCSAPTTASIAASAAPTSPSPIDEDVPFTPAWAERITGLSRDKIITVAREFATNAEKTNGRSMVILGAGLNHWYHMDMNYRGIMNLLIMCGCVGQSGGGWSHYVGQEKLRPQTGWLPLAFAPRLGRARRASMNSTSFWYAHTDQWRYESSPSMRSCRRQRRRAIGPVR